MNPGIAYALAAFLTWGLLPLYMRLLVPVAASEIVAQRIVWSLATVAIVLAALRRTAWLRTVLERPASVLRYAVTATLISFNWLIYIWAINSGHVVDSSLGYFINPLLNVLLGALLLGERLRVGQSACIGMAALGVAWLTWQAGALPWIGLVLAATFALYGLLRKTAPLGAIEGFSVEAALLTPFALAYLAWLYAHGTLGFAHAPAQVRWLLVLAGPVTTVPLVLFAAGARRIPLSLLGVLQYLAPTLQWLCGIYVFNEPFDSREAVGYGIIWFALGLYAIEGAWAGWARSRLAAG